MHEFETLYADMVETAAIESIHRSKTKMLMDVIRDRLRLVHSSRSSNTDSASYHAQTLHRLSYYWRTRQPRGAELTCYVCLAHAPEVRLPCQHTVCENCIQIFGLEGSKHGTWTFALENCPLCNLNFDKKFLVRIKPPTAGVRILAVDGGGSRAVIPLGFLDELTKSMEMTSEIQDNFDLAIGTSSGIDLEGTNRSQANEN